MHMLFCTSGMSIICNWLFPSVLSHLVRTREFLHVTMRELFIQLKNVFKYYRLLLLGNRSLTRNKTQIAMINILNLRILIT